MEDSREKVTDMALSLLRLLYRWRIEKRLPRRTNNITDQFSWSLLFVVLIA